MSEWVKWRGAASQALRAAVDHWPVAGLSEGDAKRLRARVKGALRRLDVRVSGWAVGVVTHKSACCDQQCPS
jgi:hypothetical protein